MCSAAFSVLCVPGLALLVLTMNERRVIALLLLCLSVLLVPRQASAATYADAMTECQASASHDGAGSGWAAATCVAGTGGQCSAMNGGPNDNSFPAILETQVYISNGFKRCITKFNFDGVIPPDLNCHAGQIVPAGTPYKQSSTSGESCTAIDHCQLTLMLGGDSSGSLAMTGQVCAGTVSPDEKPLPDVAETTNADGSKTYCDPISGKCVTATPAASDAPASSSSGPNNSTDTTTKTDTPASSSSSTTTSTGSSTTTGDGSGENGTGNSTTVSNGTSTTKTDVPASSSSSASKCTTGACDVGNADGNVGQLYQPGVDTIGSVYGDFKAQVSSAPIMSAATGFFEASNLTGTCPSWHIPGNKYWGESGFSFDFFCSSGMLALFTLAGFMVLAVGAFSAFRIAIY